MAIVPKYLKVSFVCFLLFQGILLCQLRSQNVLISNTSNRNSTSLNGKWKYVIDQYETGQIGFLPISANLKPKDKTDRVEYSFDQSQTLWVPGSWNSQKLRPNRWLGWHGLMDSD